MIDREKRLTLASLTLAWCCLAAGCDKQSAALAVLNLGFNAQVENGSVVTMETVSSGDQAEPSGTKFASLAAAPKEDAELTVLWRELDSLRHAMSAGETPSETRLNDLGTRAEAALRRLSSQGARAEIDEQLQAARDARLFVLSAAARLPNPEYRQTLNAFSREVSGADYDPTYASQASAGRFVTHYLSRDRIDSTVIQALRRHAIAHPDCELNLPLYLTTVERIANEGAGRDAIALADDGIARFATHAELHRLRELRQRLTAAGRP